MSNKSRILFGSTIWGALIRVILLFIFVTFPFFYHYSFVVVWGDSMYDNYDNGELLIVRRTKGLYQPQRFDVVCIQAGDGPWVKRIIGLPGDHI